MISQAGIPPRWWRFNGLFLITGVDGIIIESFFGLSWTKPLRSCWLRQYTAVCRHWISVRNALMVDFNHLLPNKCYWLSRVCLSDDNNYANLCKLQMLHGPFACWENVQQRLFFGLCSLTNAQGCQLVLKSVGTITLSKSEVRSVGYHKLHWFYFR